MITNNIQGKQVYWAIATNQAGERRASRPLTLQVLPDNDNFANAAPVESLRYGDFIDFTGATLEPGESSHGATGAVVSRWWRWGCRGS